MKLIYISSAIFVGSAFIFNKINAPIEIVDLSSSNTEVPSTSGNLTSEPLSISDIDSSLESNANCYVSLALKDWFDTHLNTFGEQDFEAIDQQVSQQILAKCNTTTRDTALDIWQRYIEYKTDLAGFDQSQQNLRDFRLNYFSNTEYETWFGEQAQYDQFMKDQLSVAKRTDLNQEQKAALRTYLEQDLPASIKATRERSQRYGQLTEQVNQMREQGKSEAEIFQLRESKLGTEAAENLANLDVQRNQWKERINQLKAFQNTVDESTVSNEDKEDQLELYLSENFSETEQVRAKALVGLLEF